MTTVLADAHAGVMVADSGCSDGDRQWPNSRKVWRVRDALLGFAGNYEDIERFLAWWRAGRPHGAPKVAYCCVLVLDSSGLNVYTGSTSPTSAPSGRDAIGTGGKGAMCAYEALGWEDPRRAVRIACRYDSGSRAPVRLYRI